jgi:hypothetical protein
MTPTTPPATQKANDDGLFLIIRLSFRSTPLFVFIYVKCLYQCFMQYQ